MPRDPVPFLKLLDTTTLVDDYAAIGDLTLENLSKIEPPVHLIYGEDSAFIGSFDALRERLPHASAILLPRTEWGHFGPMEQPEIIAQHLIDLLGDGDSSDRPAPVGVAALNAKAGG